MPAEKKKPRRKLEADNGQAQLLMEIIENHGRPEAVAEKTGLSCALVSYWRTSGYVPLGRVGELARALGEDIYALNYEGVAKLVGKAPRWEDVVKGCGLSVNRTRAVLDKPRPLTVKELI